MFGEKVSRIRKRKKMTQAELGKSIGTSGDIIGKYERGEINPSIDVAGKIADSLNISLDYLAKNIQENQIDPEMLDRLKLLAKLSAEDRSHMCALMDAFIAKSKIESLHQ